MKKSNCNYVFLLCLLFMTVVYGAVEIVNASNNSTQEDFIKSHTPKSVSGVRVKTKKSASEKENKIQNRNWNLGSVEGKEGLNFEKPDWMKYSQQETLCNPKKTKRAYFANNLKSETSNKDCVRDIIYSPELNTFSRIFFQETLSGKNIKKIDSVSQEEESTGKEKHIDNAGEKNDIDLEDVKGSVGELIQDQLIDQTNIVKDNDQNVITEDLKSESEVVSMRGNKRVLELGNEFGSDVEDLLSTALGQKNIQKNEEKILEENSIELSSAIEETVKKEEVITFPDLKIHYDVDTLIQAIFLSDVKNYLFATDVNSEEYKVSSASLAHAYNLFEKDLQVIVLGELSVIGIHEGDYYNNAIRKIFFSFNKHSSNPDDVKKLAQQLSNISFSLSSYTNDELSSSIRNAFGKKLIIDIQSLESHYSGAILREEKMKNEKVKLFFADKAKVLKQQEERKKQEEKEAAAIKKIKLEERIAELKILLEEVKLKNLAKKQKQEEERKKAEQEKKKAEQEKKRNKKKKEEQKKRIEETLLGESKGIKPNSSGSSQEKETVEEKFYKNESKDEGGFFGLIMQ